MNDEDKLMEELMNEFDSNSDSDISNDDIELLINQIKSKKENDFLINLPLIKSDNTQIKELYKKIESEQLKIGVNINEQNNLIEELKENLKKYNDANNLLKTEETKLKDLSNYDGKLAELTLQYVSLNKVIDKLKNNKPKYIKIEEYVDNLIKQNGTLPVVLPDRDRTLITNDILINDFYTKLKSRQTVLNEIKKYEELKSKSPDIIKSYKESIELNTAQKQNYAMEYHNIKNKIMDIGIEIDISISKIKQYYEEIDIINNPSKTGGKQTRKKQRKCKLSKRRKTINCKLLKRRKTINHKLSKLRKIIKTKRIYN